MIALALAAKTTGEARRTLEAYAGKVGLVELRIDGMRECNLHALLHDKPCPVIVTNRPVWEGGRCDGDESARLGALIEAAAEGAEHIDCELAAIERLDRRALGNAKLILSHHDFTRMPDLAQALYRCRVAGADIAKAVGMASTILDAAMALRALQSADTPAISLAMGAPGIVSRILAFKYGAYLTFASLGEPGRETAPGQVSIEVLHGTYRVDEIDAETRVGGYLAPAPAPLEELAHINVQLRRKGCNAVVVPLELGSEHPRDVISAFTALGFTGFATSSGMPPMEGVADSLEALAERL